MGLMRRLAVAALAAVLVLSTALGERVTFRLSAADGGGRRGGVGWQL